MDPQFRALPPLKRFTLLQKQQEHDNARLPAKKRKDSRHPPPPPAAETGGATTYYSLPAKKRVRAFQPDLISGDPFSPFDLNVEYKPSAQEEKATPIPIPSQTQTQPTCNDDDDDDDDEDDGVLCAICHSTDGDPSDPIVFCDGCDLMVHSSCYGDPLVKGVPDGEWFCSRCSAADPISCCLCPVAGGAVKPTADGRWAHILCALFVPEVFFRDPEGREGIDLSMVPKRRWSDRCYLCKNRSGCAIDCSEPRCDLAFHVTCGLEEELCIEYREGKKKGAVVAGFCKDHSELWKKQQQTGKFKIVARED